MTVPNLFPTRPSTRKLALIGEAPGADEVTFRQPFVGQSGRFLTSLLSRAGMSREECFLGNITQHRPHNNEIQNFTWNGPEITSGLVQLRLDLAQFKPNIVVLLGNTALKAAKDFARVHPLKPNAFEFKNANWRGSLFRTDPLSPFAGVKATCSYHPAYCLRDYDATPFLQLDIRKAVREADFPDLRLPQRVYRIPETLHETVGLLKAARGRITLVGSDIEGYWNRLRCIAFALSPQYAFIVPFIRCNGNRYWTSPVDEAAVWRELALTLECPTLPKVFQNGLYDRFALQYGHGIHVSNCPEDTMLKHWSLYSELGQPDDRKKGKKGLSLAIQASIYTDEPYYKDDGDSTDDKTFYEYCMRDACVTLEIAQSLEAIFTNPAPTSGFRLEELKSMDRQYRANIELLHPFLYMEQVGMRYDVNGAALRRQTLLTKQYEAQAKLNALTGYGFTWTSQAEIRDWIKARCYTKKGDRPYKEYEEACARINELSDLPPTLATIGEIEVLSGKSLNVDSPPDLQAYLYNTLKLPIQYKPQPRNYIGPDTPTVDYEALLKLCREVQKHSPHDPRLRILNLIIEIGSLGTRSQMLSISADDDKRIRCGYNLVGSNTGRVTCYKSPTGSGYNLQTIPNYTQINEAPGGVLGDRDLFLADPGYWFFQCDLKGADGWTVAAYSKMCSDSNMLDDYKSGVSPFEVLVLLMKGLKIPVERDELKAECKQHVKKDSWERFAMKRVQHGGCYLEGGLTISRNILKDSEGKLYLSSTECDKLKDYFFTRYWGIKRWHDWVGRRLSERMVLRAASGQVRQFFGRSVQDVLTKAVAFEPQANTTYATNLALRKMWTDPENRDGKKLIIQPLHTVHDALCGQFPKERTDWAVAKIRSYFNNPIEIAGEIINIPYDGGAGPSWGDTSTIKL